MTRHTQQTALKARREAGFTLLEAVFAAAILSVGMLAMVAVFGVAMSSTQSAQQDQIARQKAREALENIFTARAQSIPFDNIKNDVNGGIFLSGFQPLKAPGPDGLVGTANDVNVPGCPSGIECVILPGADGILGNGDDVTLSLSNYQRQIAIADVLNPDGTVNDNLRQITVTIQYTTPKPRTYAVTTLISSYK